MRSSAKLFLGLLVIFCSAWFVGAYKPQGVESTTPAPTAGRFIRFTGAGVLAEDSGVANTDLVHRTGDETINGTKTFGSAISAPNVGPSTMTPQSVGFYVATTGLPENDGLTQNTAVDSLETAMDKIPIGFRGEIWFIVFPGTYPGLWLSGSPGNAGRACFDFDDDGVGYRDPSSIHIMSYNGAGGVTFDTVPSGGPVTVPAIFGSSGPATTLSLHNVIIDMGGSDIHGIWVRNDATATLDDVTFLDEGTAYSNYPIYVDGGNVYVNGPGIYITQAATQTAGGVCVFNGGKFVAATGAQVHGEDMYGTIEAYGGSVSIADLLVDNNDTGVWIEGSTFTAGTIVMNDTIHGLYGWDAAYLVQRDDWTIDGAPDGNPTGMLLDNGSFFSSIGGVLTFTDYETAVYLNGSSKFMGQQYNPSSLFITDCANGFTVVGGSTVSAKDPTFSNVTTKYGLQLGQVFDATRISSQYREVGVQKQISRTAFAKTYETKGNTNRSQTDTSNELVVSTNYAATKIYTGVYTDYGSATVHLIRGNLGLDDYLDFEVRSDSAGSPGSVVYTSPSRVYGCNINSGSPVDISFEMHCTLTASTWYWIVLKRTGSNSYKWYAADSTARWSTSSNGSSWTNGDYEGCYYLYGETGFHTRMSTYSGKVLDAENYCEKAVVARSYRSTAVTATTSDGNAVEATTVATGTAAVKGTNDRGTGVYGVSKQGQGGWFGQSGTLDSNLSEPVTKVVRNVTLGGKTVNVPVSWVEDANGSGNAQATHYWVWNGRPDSGKPFILFNPGDTTLDDGDYFFKRANRTDYYLDLKGNLRLPGNVDINGRLLQIDKVTYSSTTNPISSTIDYVFCDISGGSITLTLSVVTGKVWHFKVSAFAGSNTVTLTPASGTIDGAASNNSVLVALYSSCDVYCDGTNFWIY